MKNNMEPSGIGGWLILPMLGLIITPIQASFLLATTYVPIFYGETWKALTNPMSQAYDPLWAPVLIFEALGNVCFIFFCLALLILLFQRYHRFPQMMVILYVSNILFFAIDSFMINSMPAISNSDAGSLEGLMRAILYAAIWVPYFLKSIRVRNTFNKSRPHATVEPPKSSVVALR